MSSKVGYRQFPRIYTGICADKVAVGAERVMKRLSEKAGKVLASGKKNCVVVIECYPGTDISFLTDTVREKIAPSLLIESDELAFEPEKTDDIIKKDLTDDPVFGIMTVRSLEDFFYSDKLSAAAAEINEHRGFVFVIGVGASLVCSADILVYADITRWEIQLRYRNGMKNWRCALGDQTKQDKYKRGYFAEWRWADKVKDRLLPVIDFYMDMTGREDISMVDADAYREALKMASGRPFRLVPYFDPGVWGGDWMKRHFDLPENNSNYAWSFDGVPEENSLLLDFSGSVIETPALNLVLEQPERLLGGRVRARFGKEFPIRFDMLDTVNGQNLSLQVHPLTEYIAEKFNMRYTQDESYYILDAEPGKSCVYLGMRTDASFDEMADDLLAAKKGDAPFPAEKYINRIPVKKHDHILIPAGTIHCSGAGTMVLEISATPYIFTFKLWDWGRLDLDGKPRPVHVERGLANIRKERRTEWIEKNLVGRTKTISDDGVTKVERTGLHELEFIETIRVTTSEEALVQRSDSVCVINLVEGERAVIRSRDGVFDPFELFYAETCIIPQAAGDYLICSPDNTPVSVINAYVR